jgi:hypothetical protein
MPYAYSTNNEKPVFLKKTGFLLIHDAKVYLERAFAASQKFHHFDLKLFHEEEYNIAE